jgi:hypothetical protein
MDIVAHPELPTRVDFGSFLRTRDLTGTAVEVGTHRGEYAALFLNAWPGELICVDPWRKLPSYHDMVAYGDRDADYQAAVDTLAPFANRVRLWRMLSTEAAAQIEPAALDFVHIDGNHIRRFVEEDMQSWWTRVRPGGVMSGHDLNEWEWADEVRPAVIAFAEQHQLTPYKTSAEEIESWFFIKPK